MSQVKKALYVSVALGTSLVYAQQAFATAKFDSQTIQGGMQGNTNTADSVVQTMVSYLLGFLGILAVLYALYGGFLILTAGSSEDNVKKGRKVLMHAIFGLIIIYLANSIIGFVITNLLGNA